jgi:hypothetical protein
MNATIAWLLPRASTTSIASIESLATVALFSGVGLLLSLSVLILDQNMPGNGSEASLFHRCCWRSNAQRKSRNRAKSATSSPETTELISSGCWKV